MSDIRFIHKNEKGMVLPLGLMFLAIIAILGTTAVIVTTTDLKIGSNYRASVQDFYIAEAGIQDGIGRLVSGTISDSGSETDVNWNTANNYSSTNFSNSFTVTHYASGGSVVTDSNGNPYYRIVSNAISGGSETKELEAIVGLTYPSPFEDAMHGCDGVAVASNGGTSSYSSSGEPTTGDNGSIGTSNPNADITLESNADVQGNVSATGSLTLDGNADILKNALANNGIAMNGNNSIGGDANSNGNITMKQATIVGDANSNGNIELNSIMSDILGDATASGTITCKSNCSSQITGSTNPGTPPSIDNPVAPTSDCDPLGLTSLFDDADDTVTTNDNGELGNPPFDSSSNTFSSSSNDSYSIGVSGEQKAYYFNDFSMSSNSDSTIKGDVTLYIDGNFSLNSNTEIELAPGATLTIYLTGEFTLGSNTKINKYGSPQNLKIYSNAESSNNSDYKFHLDSNSGFYGVVYAPDSAVEINSNSDIYGAVRGKYIDMASNAEFHYDEDLKNQSSGGGTPDDYVMVSWREVF